MRIVFDTNILLVSVSKKSKYHRIFEAFLKEEFSLCVTTDILTEYEEVITDYMGKEVANTVLQIIENAINVEYITKYYQWRLIKQDPDDDKFVDCAVAGNVNYLVTNDKHFDTLAGIPFPRVNVIDIFSFQKILQK